MRIFFYCFSVLVLLSCASTKEEGKGEKAVIPPPHINCPEGGDCSFEIMRNSVLNLNHSNTGQLYPEVAEGDKIGKNVSELANYVEENLKQYEVRVSVLGHMQRGGSPSCFDRVLASRLGVKAVELLLDGQSNLMVGLINNKVETTELEKAVKGHHAINKELVRVSDMMSI